MSAQPLPLDARAAGHDDAADRAFLPTRILHRTEAAAPAAPRPATLPGSAKPGTAGAPTKVGRYEVRERLGRGGMATVYRAHDPSIGRDVALKFLHASLCENADCHARFLREARAAGGLSHPHIVVVHDVGEIDGRPFMAMELLTGGTLADELAEGRRLALRDAVEVTLQMALALDYAHGRGVVHRDVKPANIMRDAASGAVKLADFGIAHLDEAARAGEQRTRIGDVLGTPHYMSPEQTRGEKLDGRSDLFSVGIVLYQMLTGQRPFHGDSLVMVATQITGSEPVPVARLRGEVPPALRRVVERCLAKDPARRFQTGRELVDALAPVRAALARQPGAVRRGGAARWPAAWAAVSLVALALAGAAGAAWYAVEQREALQAQALEHGAMLARFSAAQNAAALLGEDWEAIDVALQATMKTGRIERLLIVDLGGVVRAASQPGLVGQPYRPPAGQQHAGVLHYASGPRGETMLGFEAPVTFQGKPIGRVFLGLPERPQRAAG